MTEITKKVKLFGKDYEASYPNAGQMMEIDNKKVLLSDNTYGQQLRVGTRGAKFNLDLIDAFCIFSVLLPNLIKDLGINNFLDLDHVRTKELVKVYRGDFYKWYQAFLRDMYDEYDAELLEEDEKSEEKENG